MKKLLLTAALSFISLTLATAQGYSDRNNDSDSHLNLWILFSVISIIIVIVFASRSKQDYNDNKYPALRTIAIMNRVLAYIYLIIGIIFSLYCYFHDDNVRVMIGALVISFFLFIVVLALAESIMVFIDIEYNTRTNKGQDKLQQEQNRLQLAQLHLLSSIAGKLNVPAVEINDIMNPYGATFEETEQHQENVESVHNQVPTKSKEEALKELKKLLDRGAITRMEFDFQKNELLSD